MRQVVSAGKVIEPKHSLQEIADYVRDQLSNEIWEEEQRFENPHIHYLNMSPDYYEMKMDLLKEVSK